MVASKEPSEKKTPRKRSTLKAETPTLEKVVQENVRHIEENTREIHNNSNMIHILYGIIIALMLVISGLAFYIGTKLGGGGTAGTEIVQAQDIEITVYDDIRCLDCQTSVIVDQLKQLPFLAGATFIEKDFSESGVSEFLKENNLTLLPAITFNTKSFADGGQITPFLTPLASWDVFSLGLWEVSKFDPFAKRSENGFLYLEKDVLAQVREGLSLTGATEPKFLWIEYSDLGCSACQQFHKSGIEAQAFEKHGSVIAKALVWFLTVGGQVSADAMEAIECMNEQDTTLHHTAWTHFYKTGNFGSDALKTFAEENWVNIGKYETCLNDNSMLQKIEEQRQIGVDVFEVRGTPGNIILNTETGEYQSAGWSIVETLDAMMR